MQQYNHFKYLYPNIAKRKTSVKYLDSFDTGEYLFTPNYEGQSCIIFTNGFELMIYDHRGKILKDVSSSIDFRKLAHNGKWFVYIGLYCARYKNVEMNFTQDRFIITDVLVWDGEYLLNSTLLERLSLLDHAFKFNATLITDCYTETFKFLYCTEIPGIFKAKYYSADFENIYQQFIIGKYNGAILRKKESALLDSTRSRNNRQDDILCRNKTSFFNF